MALWVLPLVALSCLGLFSQSLKFVYKDDHTLQKGDARRRHSWHNVVSQWEKRCAKTPRGDTHLYFIFDNGSFRHVGEIPKRVLEDNPLTISKLAMARLGHEEEPTPEMIKKRKDFIFGENVRELEFRPLVELAKNFVISEDNPHEIANMFAIPRVVFVDKGLQSVGWIAIDRRHLLFWGYPPVAAFYSAYSDRSRVVHTAHFRHIPIILPSKIVPLPKQFPREAVWAKAARLFRRKRKPIEMPAPKNSLCGANDSYFLQRPDLQNVYKIVFRGKDVLPLRGSAPEGRLCWEKSGDENTEVENTEAASSRRTRKQTRRKSKYQKAKQTSGNDHNQWRTESRNEFYSDTNQFGIPPFSPMGYQL